MCPESDCPMPMCINIAALIAAKIGRSLKVGRGCVISDHIVPLVWSGGTYSTSTDSASGTKSQGNVTFCENTQIHVICICAVSEIHTFLHVWKYFLYFPIRLPKLKFQI